MRLTRYLRDVWHRHFGSVLVTFCLVVAVSVYFLSNVSQRITERDRKAIAALQVDDECASTPTFREEVECARAIQGALMWRVPDQRCATDWFDYEHEPMDLLERGFGCCVSRSRFIEKALHHYGFAIRHVALHQLEWVFPVGYLEPRIRSHAFTEVKTSRGWMVVDSLHRFVGLTEQGEALTARELKAFGDGTPPADRRLVASLPDPFRLDYRVAYGLYSRHGFFFGAEAPVPDIDWRQFGYNFAGSAR